MGDNGKIFDDAVEHAGGKFEITVNGKESHVSGDANSTGLMMAAYGMVHIFARCAGGFDKAITMLTQLNEILDSEITEGKRNDCAD